MTSHNDIPWHDNDDFWRDTMATLFGKARWEAAPEEVEQVLALVEVETGAKVLDLPCGPGRHSLELARRGFAVTGVDRTRLYLDEARRHGQEAGLEVEWLAADMRSFDGGGAFALLLNLFTSFGFFEDPAEDRQVAGHFFAALQPGGQLVMDLMSKEVLASRFRERDWSRTDDGTLMLEERELEDGWGWIDNTWTFLRGDLKCVHHFGHRLYAATELVALLEGVGFVEPRTYGTLEGTPYDHTAQRLIVVARRPS